MLICKTPAAILVLVAFLFASCQSNTVAPATNAENSISNPLSNREQVDYGRMLVTVGGCNDCHTPKIFSAKGMAFDSSRLLSGYPAGTKLPTPSASALKPGNWGQLAPDVTAFVGPWGISYAANLTPDSATGLGVLSEANFINTVRSGKHWGGGTGRDLLPPMPWYNLARLDDKELKAIYAYLHSLPPVSNAVPAPVSPEDVAKMKMD
jgi:mono/diheme cytochrome c family protein